MSKQLRNALLPLLLTSHLANSASLGQLLNQAQQEFPVIYLPSVGIIGESSKSFTLADGEGVGIVVNGYRFSGNDSLSNSTLEAALKPFSQRTLTPKQIYSLTSFIRQLYREYDIVATAEVPPQDVEGGIIDIQITESRFAGVELDYGFEDSFNVSLERIETTAQNGISSDQPLKVSELERGQLLAIDLHGVAVSGGHHPDGSGGEVLELWIENTPKFSGTLDFKNRTDSNEKIQAVLTSLYSSPFNRGGALYINGIKEEQLNFASLAYRGPIGYDGATFDIQAGTLQSDRSSSGSRAYSYSAGYRYPVVRSVAHNLFLTTQAERRDLGYHLDSLTLSLDGNRALNWGRLTYNTAVTLGENDSLNSSSSGEFKLASGFLNYNQRSESGWRTNARLSGQLTSTPLDDSERLIVGGPNALRGYTAADGLADQGLLLRLDLRKQVSQKLTLGVLYDRGELQSRKGDKTNLRLSNLGAAMRYSLDKDMRLEISAAKALDDSTGRTQRGDWQLHAQFTIPF